MSIGKVTAESALEPTAPAGPVPSAHRAPLLFVLAVSALLFGFVSGLRWPSNWATTHYLFDYSNGFIKRGFTGEVLSYVAGDSLSYGSIAALSFAIFAIWLSMLFLRLRGLAKIDNRIWIITAVVLISPGFVFQVRNIGYLDHIGLIIVFLCFFLPANLSGLVARTGLCGLMIIIHEAFFLMFFPLVILEFTIRAMLTGGRGRIAATWIAVAVLAALTFVVAQTTLPAADRAAYNAHASERASDFTVRRDAVETLFRDGRDNIHIASETRQITLPLDVAVVGFAFLLPLPIALVSASLHMVRQASLTPRARLYLWFAIAAGAFSPFLLNIFAWDVWRFLAIMQISAFLVFVTVASQLPGSISRRPWPRSAGAVLLFFVVSGAIVNARLLDSYSLTTAPYLLNIAPLIDVFHGEIRIPSR